MRKICLGKKTYYEYKVGVVFYMIKTNGLFWFRFFNGYGVHGKNYLNHPLLFSERYKKSKSFRIGNWIFRILRPNKN